MRSEVPRRVAYHHRRRGETLAGVIQGKVDETQLKAMLEQINEKTEQKVKVRRANNRCNLSFCSYLLPRLLLRAA